VLTNSITVNASRFLSFWLLLLLFAASPVSALDPSKPITQYAHTAWRLQDGFFGTAPRAITQTADGYIWIGTQNELFQFDGIRFVKWTPPAGSQFTPLRINVLLGSSDGSLWIGTDSGLARWKDRKLITEMGSTGRVTSIIQRRNGEIWFSRILYHDYDATGPVCRVDGAQSQCFAQAEGIPVRDANSLVEDPAGNLWFGNPSTVVRWNGKFSRTFNPPALKGNQSDGINGITPTADGSTWVGFAIKGRGIGLQQIVNDVPKPFVTAELDSSNIAVRALFLDKRNSLWIGTESQGIIRIRAGTVDRFRSVDGLSSDFVTGFQEDREGNLWVTTSRGMDCFRDLRVTSYTTREGLPNDEVDSVLASRDGTIWVGGPGGLTSIRGKEISSIQPRKGLPGNLVTSLFEDHAGRIWVGIDNALFIYKNGAFRPVRKRNGRPIGFVVGLAEDEEHNIWAETIGSPRTLFRIRDFSVQQEFPAPQFPTARKLTAAMDGSIWLGLLTGDLARYKGSKLDVFRYKNSASPSFDTAVNAVAIGPDGSVLGATPFGLIGWKDGKQQTLTVQNGLPCDVIYELVTDNRGALWLYTQCGIVEISNAELQKWWADRNSTRHLLTIGVLDGAQPGQVPFKGAASSVDGRLWFANGSGLQVIDPSDKTANSTVSAVHIQDIVAGHKSYDSDQDVALPANSSDLQIDYTALSFRNPKKITFRYKLEGRDKTWNDAGTRRQAFYTDLPPGQYRFQVIASNNGEEWSEQGATLTFSIAPAWYQTKFFQTTCVLLGVLLVWTIHRLRVRQVAKTMGARFDERLAERTRIARDLHDTLLQTINGSKLVADDALETPSEPLRMRKALEQLSEWLQLAGQEGRAALNSLRVSATNTDDLAEAFKRVLQTAPLHSLPATISVSGDVREIHPIVRDEVYRVGYEAIRNVHAHSGGDHIEIQLRYTDDLMLRVVDNGVGADASTFSDGKVGHYGVKGMRERASRIGARLSIVSDASRGTEVCLVVPGAIAFRDARASRQWRISDVLRRVKSNATKSKP
jgi:signal transduction histidine kinase/ligand-binding sensor domain-containing protein